MTTRNTYMLGSGRGSDGSGGGGNGPKTTQPPSPFLLHDEPNRDDEGREFVDLGAAADEDELEDCGPVRRRPGEELGFVHAPLGQHLSKPARPMSAGPGSVASRTFETPGALRRYLGSQSIRPSSSSKPRDDKQKFSLVGVEGAKPKKERPRTANARLRSVKAKVDSRSGAGEGKSRGAEAKKESFGFATNTNTHPPFALDFNVLTDAQKAAIKAKRDAKRAKRIQQERENLRKKVLNASAKSIIYRHVQGARGGTQDPEAISGNANEGKVYCKFKGGGKDKRAAKISKMNLEASGSLY